MRSSRVRRRYAERGEPDEARALVERGDSDRSQDRRRQRGLRARSVRGIPERARRCARGSRSESATARDPVAKGHALGYSEVTSVTPRTSSRPRTSERTKRCCVSTAESSLIAHRSARRGRGRAAQGARLLPHGRGDAVPPTGRGASRPHRLMAAPRRERKVVTVVFCDLVGFTHARRVARPRGRRGAPASVPRTCPRRARAARRDGREVHRRRGDGALRRAGRARGRPGARGASARSPSATSRSRTGSSCGSVSRPARRSSRSTRARPRAKGWRRVTS